MEDLYADEELYEDEAEEGMEGEGANRTFILLAAGLGGLLVVALCIFAVWAFVINPRMTADRVTENHSIESTNEAIGATATAGAFAAQPEATDTPVPVSAGEDTELTATKNPPTATPRPPTATPKPDTPTPAEMAAGDATEEPTEATPAEVASGAEDTTQATPTQATQASAKQGVPETGVGAWGAGILALGLLLLLIVVRRVRQAV